MQTRDDDDGRVVLNFFEGPVSRMLTFLLFNPTLCMSRWGNTVELSMANTPVVVSTVGGIIGIHRNLFCAAPVSTSSAFVVSTSRCSRTNHRSP
ncbi:hypothetical protein DsansV1_C18g0155121 [Dioscorea sansibarensis]